MNKVLDIIYAKLNKKRKRNNLKVNEKHDKIILSFTLVRKCFSTSIYELI